MTTKGRDVKLTHIAITNWRNFAHIEFDLSSRLFVVGPNSSGKTNLLAALRFLSDVARRGLVAASEDLGGPERYFRSGTEKVSFGVALESAENLLTCTLSLRHDSSDASSRLEEEVVYYREPQFPMYSFAPMRGRGIDIDSQSFAVEPKAIVKTDEQARVKNGIYFALPDDDTCFAHEGYVVQPRQELRERVRQMLAGIRYIHPNPKKMLERSDRYDPDHGTGFFQHAGRFSDQQLDAVVDRIRPIMAAVVPEIPNLSYQRMGLGTELVFYSDTPVRGATGVYSHEQFSEGTLRLLGLLFDLATLPRDTSVVLIEEPETFLQASVVRSLPSLLAEFAMNRDVQMIISTHSPELIDSELVLPSQVLMLRSENGETTGQLLSESNDPRIKAVVSARLPKSQGIDAVNGRTIPQGTL